MFREFIQKFQENLSQITCIPIITIFTLHKESCEKYQYANHPFYNSGGIHTQYDELIQTFLKLFNSNEGNRSKYNITSIYQ